MGNINRSYKIPAQQKKASQVGMGYDNQCVDVSGGKASMGVPKTTARGNPNASKSSSIPPRKMK